MEGSVIIMRNQDRPGVIGSVGTLLGSRGINVSRMQVGLDEKSGQALALWNVDSTVAAMPSTSFADRPRQQCA